MTTTAAEESRVESMLYWYNVEFYKVNFIFVASVVTSPSTDEIITLDM